MALGALKMMFYNLVYTRECWFDSNLLFRCLKTPIKALTLNRFPGHFCSLPHQYPVKFTAQFDINKEEKIWVIWKKFSFLAGHLKLPAISTTFVCIWYLICVIYNRGTCKRDKKHCCFHWELNYGLNSNLEQREYVYGTM